MITESGAKITDIECDGFVVLSNIGHYQSNSKFRIMTPKFWPPLDKTITDLLIQEDKTFTSNIPSTEKYMFSYKMGNFCKLKACEQTYQKDIYTVYCREGRSKIIDKLENQTLKMEIHFWEKRINFEYFYSGLLLVANEILNQNKQYTLAIPMDYSTQNAEISTVINEIVFLIFSKLKNVNVILSIYKDEDIPF